MGGGGRAPETLTVVGGRYRSDSSTARAQRGPAPEGDLSGGANSGRGYWPWGTRNQKKVDWMDGSDLSEVQKV